ncbi:MAG TPA: hypothetical protein VL860_09715, partial [Planctomycetota bacterium]|nr:hypothetical protein [Planctomycetota bacterium]
MTSASTPANTPRRRMRHSVLAAAALAAGAAAVWSMLPAPLVRAEGPAAVSGAPRPVAGPAGD